MMVGNVVLRHVVPARIGSTVLRLPCEQVDPDLWFAERPRDVELAKSLCRQCPVRQRCLADALERTEPWGVWGGEILIRGSVVATKRGRGRPPKAARRSGGLTSANAVPLPRAS